MTPTGTTSNGSAVSLPRRQKKGLFAGARGSVFTHGRLAEVGDVARLRERQHRLEPAGARRDVEHVGAVAALKLRAQGIRVRRPDRQVRRVDLDVGVELLEPVEDRLQLWVALPVGLGEDLDRRLLRPRARNACAGRERHDGDGRQREPVNGRTPTRRPCHRFHALSPPWVCVSLSCPCRHLGDPVRDRRPCRTSRAGRRDRTRRPRRRRATRCRPTRRRRRRRSHPRRERRAAPGSGPTGREPAASTSQNFACTYAIDDTSGAQTCGSCRPETDEARLQLDASDVGEVERGRADRRARASAYPTPRARRAPPPDRVSQPARTAASRNAAGTAFIDTLASRTRAIADVSSRSRSSRIDDTAALSGVCPPWISVASVTPPASAAGTSRSRTSAGIPAWSRTIGNPSDRAASICGLRKAIASSGVISRSTRRMRSAYPPSAVGSRSCRSAEAPECEHLVAREPRELTPGLIADELDARPESLAPDAPKHLRERNGTAPATRS